MTFFKRFYGHGPLHLLGHIVSIAIAFWAVGLMLDAGPTERVALWFIGGAILQDALFVPLYSALDLVSRAGSGDGITVRRPVPVINYIRFPAVIAGTLFLVWFPLILARSEDNLVRTANEDADGFLLSWLLTTGAVFLVSAVLYALKLRRVHAAPAPAATS